MKTLRSFCLFLLIAAIPLLSACFGKYYDYPSNKVDWRASDVQNVELDHRGQPFWNFEHQYWGVNYHDFKVCMDPDESLRMYLATNSYDCANWRTDPVENDGACLVCTARRDLLPVGIAKAKDDPRHVMSVVARVLHQNRKYNTDFRMLPTKFNGQPAVEFFVRSVPPNGKSLTSHGFISAIPGRHDAYLEVTYLMTENSPFKEEMLDLGEKFIKSVKFR